ncbi:MAG TPA: DUF4843 domain-containing protein, partial [Mucilaginibacter sp.]
MKKNILLMLLVSAVMLGCKKEGVTTYQSPDGKDNIYLDYANTDSLVYTFAYTPALSRDTVWVPVKISGKRVNHPRSFKLSVNEGSTTAVRV